MLEPMPFALQATSADPTHAELAVSLARAFRPVDPVALDDGLERLAAAVPTPAADTPPAQLAALSALIRTAAWPRSARSTGPWGALLPSALARGPAHPLTLAVLVTEVARRRGFPVGIVSNGSDHLNGHEELSRPLLLRPDDGAIVDARELPPPLTWRCSHETCAMSLDLLEPLSLRYGRLDHAITCAELRLCLPFEDGTLARARTRLAHARALLN